MTLLPQKKNKQVFTVGKESNTLDLRVTFSCPLSTEYFPIKKRGNREDITLRFIIIIIKSETETQLGLVKDFVFFLSILKIFNCKQEK